MSYIFNKKILEHHRDRCVDDLDKHDFLFKDSMQDIVDRAIFYKASYENILDLGCRIGYFNRLAKNQLSFQNLFQADLSHKMLNQAEGVRVQCDEELMPFADNSFDLVVSNLNLHWSNDLPRVLEKIHCILAKDGVFIASLIGGRSLSSLRKLIIKTEMDLGYNIGFRISPMIASESLLPLSQRAGFKKIVIDSDVIRIEYSNLLALLHDLKNIGESNCMLDKVTYLRRDILQHLSAIHNFECEFEILTISAVK